MGQGGQAFEDCKLMHRTPSLRRRSCNRNPTNDVLRHQIGE